MTALPKASRMAEDHPQCRKMLNRGRFLWISGAKKKKNRSLQLNPKKRQNRKYLLKKRGHATHLDFNLANVLVCFVFSLSLKRSFSSQVQCMNC